MTKTLEILYYLDDGRPSRQMHRTDAQNRCTVVNTDVQMGCADDAM